MSSNDKSLIAGLMESFVSEAPAKPFVSFCVFCNRGVINDEMIYQKGKVFHKDCYDKHGNSYPQVNQDLLSESANAKVQLIQLKNLQIRMSEGSSSDKPKTKKKVKHKTKRRPKKRVTKRKKTPTKRKKTSRKSSKKGRIVKRRTSPKRKKSKRKTKRRVSRKSRRRR